MFNKLCIGLSLTWVLTLGSVVAKPETCFTQKQVEADIQQVYTTLQQAHFDLYAHVSESDYAAWYDQVKQQIEYWKGRTG